MVRRTSGSGSQVHGRCAGYRFVVYDASFDAANQPLCHGIIDLGPGEAGQSRNSAEPNRITRWVLDQPHNPVTSSASSERTSSSSSSSLAEPLINDTCDPLAGPALPVETSFSALSPPREANRSSADSSLGELGAGSLRIAICSPLPSESETRLR